MGERLSAVLLVQVLDHLQLKRDRFIDRDRPFDVLIDFIKRVQHEFAYLRVTGDRTSYFESVNLRRRQIALRDE